MSVSIRPAAADDVDFLVELYADDDVRPFLAAGRPYDREWVVANLESLVVAELDGARAGAMAWQVESERNGIVHVSGLAVHPRFRGRRLADEAARLFQRHLLLERGFHRIELEVYGFNERAQRHAERSGFVREGVKRQAYRRGDGWVDSVLYGLVAEDLDTPR
ncbi:MAG: GNAT family N-acetyltransferase [Thermoleophilia bacterium]|nr:GNAT family N-acetyltransferase [Thermoleophilia bacterium]